MKKRGLSRVVLGAALSLAMSTFTANAFAQGAGGGAGGAGVGAGASASGGGGSASAGSNFERVQRREQQYERREPRAGRWLGAWSLGF